MIVEKALDVHGTGRRHAYCPALICRVGKVWVSALRLGPMSAVARVSIAEVGPDKPERFIGSSIRGTRMECMPHKSGPVRPAIPIFRPSAFLCKSFSVDACSGTGTARSRRLEQDGERALSLGLLRTAQTPARGLTGPHRVRLGAA